MEAPAPTNELAPHAPWFSTKRHLLVLASVAWEAALALWTTGARAPYAWLGAVTSLAVAVVAVRQLSREGRALGWGLALVLGSLGPQGGHLALDACGLIGAGVCAATATLAIARIPRAVGFIGAPPASSIVTVLAVSTFWGLALGVRVLPPSNAFGRWAGHPRLWAIGAAVASALVLLLAVGRTVRRRGLELGLPERALAMRAILSIWIGMTLATTALVRVQGDAIARLIVAVASAAVAGAALHSDAVRVARLTRRVVVITSAGVCFGLFGASAVARMEGDAWGATVVVAVLAVAVGAMAGALEAPLRPAGGAWLDAFRRAEAETSRAEPDDAFRGVLMALRAPAGLSSPSPELWTFGPPTATKVDSAGYLHSTDALLPEGLVVAAAGEPEGCLRADVLDRLEVRRPDLRPLAKWMADRDAVLATVVACDGEAEGLLLFPRALRARPTTLEELRALKSVADRLAAACRARAAHGRMLALATEASERAELGRKEVERLIHERALDGGRDTLATTRLAGPVTVGMYSAASRMALEALERCTAIGASIAVVAPRGVDPIPYLARAHLAGARREAPLVLVDATRAQEHDLSRWLDARLSPLALADRGMLVLLDGAALPTDLQRLVALAFDGKRAPWAGEAPLDIQFAFTAAVRPEQLLTETRLDPSLARWLADTGTSVVVLPHLRDRVEDLRAIITDWLAREGLAVLGRPVGIERAAYARLIEYPFPGEDAELGVIIQTLLARCRGDIVRLADVDALRLSFAPRRGAVRRKSPLSA